MRTRLFIVLTSVTALAAAILAAQSSNGPYKVLKSARVGGEGGWDYIYADAAGRRLYIPRRGTAAALLRAFPGGFLPGGLFLRPAAALSRGFAASGGRLAASRLA